MPEANTPKMAEPRSVLLNDFKRQWADVAGDVLNAVERVGASGWYILGQEVREFESALATLWRLPHAIGVASGLDALQLALTALGCNPGDRVITTPVSAFATTLAIVRIGAVPVIVDCDDAGLIDLDAVERCLAVTEGIRFLVPVHLFGISVDLEHLSHIRNRFGIAIVEDCAQSILTTHNGMPTGHVGEAAAVSFYPTKNLGALGDGGAVLTRDARLADRVRILRDYGQTRKYEHSEIGFNSRLDEMHAAILRSALLPRLSEWTERRRAIARAYKDRLSNRLLRPVLAPEKCDPCCHLAPVIIADSAKTGFMRYLRERQIYTGEHYPVAIPDQPAMQRCSYEVFGTIERARGFCRSEVSLPIHPYLVDEELARVIEACNSWRG